MVDTICVSLSFFFFTCFSKHWSIYIIYLSIYYIYVCIFISQKYNRVHTEECKREACSVFCGSASACWGCLGLDCCKAMPDGRTASTMRLSLTLKNICHPQAILNQISFTMAWLQNEINECFWKSKTELFYSKTVRKFINCTCKFFAPKTLAGSQLVFVDQFE